MCNITEVREFFKPKTRRIGISMIMAGIIFWAGWMQFGSLEHSFPLVIAWNLLLGGLGLFIGELAGVLIARIMPSKKGSTPRAKAPDRPYSQNKDENTDVK